MLADMLRRSGLNVAERIKAVKVPGRSLAD